MDRERIPDASIDLGRSIGIRRQIRRAHVRVALFQRQMNSEGCAFAGFALDRYLTAVIFDDAIADRKAKAYAFALFRGEKGLEYLA